MVKLELTFSPQVYTKLTNIKAGLRNRFIRKAFQKVWRYLKPFIKALIPKITGLLYKSLANKSIVRGNKATLLIGASTEVSGVYNAGDKSYNRVPANYAHLVDKPTKRSKGYYFLEKQKDRASEVEQIFMDSIKESINSL